jgi:tRNA A37 methylthiotransferase MiaB
VNTCTVTAAADAQARDAIRKIHAVNPEAQIIATGCYVQRAPEELAVLPGVTWVVGNSHKPQIPTLFGTGGSLDRSASSLNSAQPTLLPAATLLTSTTSSAVAFSQGSTPSSPSFEGSVLTAWV